MPLRLDPSAAPSMWAGRARSSGHLADVAPAAAAVRCWERGARRRPAILVTVRRSRSRIGCPTPTRTDYRTAKTTTTRNKGGIDCTRGVTREQRAINRRNKLDSSSLVSSRSSVPSSGNKRTWNRNIKWMLEWHAALMRYHDFEDNLSAIAVQRFGEPFCHREGSKIAFEERPFGETVKPGDKMLFACSGIAIPHGRTRESLTRFVTSAHLVREFNENRNKDDNLRVAVRLPDNTTTDGFLGLYDKDIAIVTCSGFLAVRPTPDLESDLLGCHSVQAAGRTFNSGHLMAMHGYLYRSLHLKNLSHINTWVSSGSLDISKAVLGGPLLGSDAKILGINLDIYVTRDGISRCTFLSMNLLYKRLKKFQILNPKIEQFHGYTLPKNVSSIVPSGFMDTICRLKSHGYPMPPPLVLEFDGQLLNHFEECFGELLPWKGFPYGDPPGGSEEGVWNQLPKEVVTDVSRRVVSLASFDGYVRSFACTGLLIKWHGSKAKHTLILTSASLVRGLRNEDSIDNSLKIEVFLPPNQRAGGTLEFYNLDYNIAVVSLKKNFNAICPDDIFIKSAQNSSKKVVAIGRDAKFGILMASSGEVVKRDNGCKLDCKHLQMSTCKIKAGIGGPLINLDGSFVGMNFYDGSGVTPFLPRRKIVELLSRVDSLPSECGYDDPMPINIGGGTKKGIQKNRWPMPEAYWYHGALDTSVNDLGKHIGRRLN